MIHHQIYQIETHRLFIDYLYHFFFHLHVRLIHFIL